jgi:hypothetical protein
MKTPTLVGILILLFAPNSLPAALQFTLTPAVRSGAKGTEVIFSGTLQNTSTTDSLFLNGIQFNFTGTAASALTPESNGFFADVPGILLPNETYIGPIFTVAINSAALSDDYSGSATILGGADIFATDNLQSQNVQVSSPLVTISATTPDAYEFGGVAGVFTVGRTGSSNYDLLVQYAVTGSAMPGVRYTALSGSVTLPSGTTTVAINATPIPNDTADGDQTISLTVSPFPSYNVGAPANATVTVHDKPIDAWRLQQFGTDANVPAIAGDAADLDGDGMTNLLEYGLLSDPKLVSVGDLPSIAINSNHLQLIFRRNTSATDITYVVEARSDLGVGAWAPILTRAPGTNWTSNAAGATAMESGSGNVVSVTATDSVPIVDPNTLQPTPRRFLRLRLQR